MSIYFLKKLLYHAKFILPVSSYACITIIMAVAKIHVLISKREEENYEYKYIYHLNEADLKGRLSGRTGLLMGDLSALKHHSS